MPLKVCEICGAEFKARLNVVRTCSVKCRNDLIAQEKVAKGTTVKHCVICGKEFSRTASQTDNKTCSRECGRILAVEATKRRVTKTCTTCGMGFKTVVSNKDSAKYCSKACLYARNGETSIFAVSSVTGKIYTRQRPGLESARNAKRHAAKLNAIPKWADLCKIRGIYKACKHISEATGIPYHVDHIIPLQGELVSGLHVETNLRIIPAAENLSKANKYEEQQ